MGHMDQWRTECLGGGSLVTAPVIDTGVNVNNSGVTVKFGVSRFSYV